MADLSQFGIVQNEGKYSQEIVYTLALVYSLIDNEIANYLAPFNFSIGKFNTLVAIRHHGGKNGIKQVEVSQHLIVTPSNMTKMIDKLSKEGFVTRSPLDGDRRVNILKVTEKGEKILDKIWPGYLEAIEKMTAQLNKSKQKQLSGLLAEWFLGLKG